MEILHVSISANDNPISSLIRQMISIIICSRRSSIPDALRYNIEETIGVEHEIIVIDNSEKQHSLSSAYNAGVRLSQYPILCFMHDDVLYHTKLWGLAVVNHFKDVNTGMIGVGGTRFLGSTPTIWWAGGMHLINHEHGTICQYSIDTRRNDRNNSSLISIRPIDSNSIKVVALDGLWFCIPKRFFNFLHFDSELFENFHFYDLDISLQVFSAGYDVRVIYDILVEHISASDHNIEWIKSCERFYDKWKGAFPLSTVDLDSHQRELIEFENLRYFLDILKTNRYLFSGLVHLPWTVHRRFLLYLLKKSNSFRKLNSIMKGS